MCRLSMFNRSMVTHLGEDNLKRHFTSLTNSGGGDGIGVAALMRSGRIDVRKGVDLTEQQAARWIMTRYNNRATLFIYHTRLATRGAVIDANCHPFKVGNSLVLAHNGTSDTSGILGIAANLAHATDSEIIARALGVGLPISWLKRHRGVFIGIRHGKPFVVKRGPKSNLHRVTVGEHAWMYSTFVPRSMAHLYDTDVKLLTYNYIDGIEYRGRNPATRKEGRKHGNYQRA